MALNDGIKTIRKSYAPDDITQCCVCRDEIPPGRLVLKHKDTENLICLECIMKIAEVE